MCAKGPMDGVGAAVTRAIDDADDAVSVRSIKRFSSDIKSHECCPVNL